MGRAKRQTGAGERRKAHFASGGDIAGWRGRARRFPDARKQASKRACRDFRHA